MHENTIILLTSCREFNISRTIYYKWLKRFSKLGYLGLQDKEKAKPKMPNQIKKDKEKIILNYLIGYPTHGSRRIANELRQQGITISETGIYNVLCRKLFPVRISLVHHYTDPGNSGYTSESSYLQIQFFDFSI